MKSYRDKEGNLVLQFQDPKPKTRWCKICQANHAKKDSDLCEECDG